MNKKNNWFGNDYVGATLEPGHYPRLDFIDQEEQVLVEATVPGLTKDDIRVEYYDKKGHNGNYGCLIITGNKAPSWYGNKLLSEIHKSAFECHIGVSDELCDTNRIFIQLENGLLTITIPKYTQLKDITANISIKGRTINIE